MNSGNLLKLMLGGGLLSLVVACGGGGSSSAISNSGTPATLPSNPTTTPSTPPTDPTPTLPADGRFVAPILRSAFTVGEVIPISSQKISFIVYAKISGKSELFSSVEVSVSNGRTSTLKLITSPTAKVGHYSGNLDVTVCRDEACADPFPDSPFFLPYEIDVVPPEGSLTSYAQPKLSPIPGLPEWETFQGNAGHSGYVPASFNVKNFSPRWKLLMPSRNGRHINPSFISTGGGHLYFSNMDDGKYTAINSLYAYNEHDGRAVWSQEFGRGLENLVSPPAVSQNKVYLVADSSLYGFDATNGAQLFKSLTSSRESYDLAPTVKDGFVYHNGNGPPPTEHGLFAFDATTGVPRFWRKIGADENWAPAVESGKAYVLDGAKLLIINARTGFIEASIDSPIGNQFTENDVGTVTLGSNGNVFARQYDLSSGTRKYICFNTYTKKAIWTTGGHYTTSPAYANGILYLSNTEFEDVLEARSELTGALLWQWEPPKSESGISSNPLVTDNLVFISSRLATYAIDLRTHQAVWSYPVGGALTLSASGVLYINAGFSITAINLR